MDFALARRAMVDSQLRPQGVTDAAVLAAMGSVERERFVPESARAFAYFDRSIPLGDGRAMMPPAALGRLLAELAPRPGERALVVGAAGDYSAEVLRAIGLAVDSGEGKGRYDLILVDGAVEQVPDSLVRQLAPGGRIGTAVIDRGVTRLAVGTVAGGVLGLRRIVDAAVAPVPGFERPKSFSF